MTKLGPKRVRPVRGRGGNMKYRALRIDAGNFSWGSESVAKKTRVLDVVYNATNNELVRTKTIVKNCIVTVDANPFRQWYLKHYDVELNKKK
jgi:small subunit ribosomal protein S8e